MRKEYDFSKGTRNKYAARICPCTRSASLFGAERWCLANVHHCKCAAKTLGCKDLHRFLKCLWPGHKTKKHHGKRPS